MHDVDKQEIFPGVLVVVVVVVLFPLGVLVGLLVVVLTTEGAVVVVVVVVLLLQPYKVTAHKAATVTAMICIVEVVVAYGDSRV